MILNLALFKKEKVYRLDIKEMFLGIPINITLNSYDFIVNLAVK